MSILYSQCMWPQVFGGADFFFFWNAFGMFFKNIIWYLRNEMSLNTEPIYVSHRPLHSTKVTTLIFLICLFAFDPSLEVRCGIFHLSCHADFRSWYTESQILMWGIINLYSMSKECLKCSYCTKILCLFKTCSLLGQQDSWVGKWAYRQTWQPELNPQTYTVQGQHLKVSFDLYTPTVPQMA